MKSILTTLLLLLSVSTFSQEVVVNQETITETERIIDKYGGKLADSFTQAMESATPMAKDGFKMVVRLQLAKGSAKLLPLILFVIFLISFKKEYKKISKNENRSDPKKGPMDEDNVTPILILYLVMTCIMFIVACFSTYGGLVRLIAPEWYAIKEIAELF